MAQNRKARKEISKSGTYAGRHKDVFMKALNTLGINEYTSGDSEWAVNDPIPGSDEECVTVFVNQGWINFYFTPETGNLISIEFDEHDEEVHNAASDGDNAGTSDKSGTFGQTTRYEASVTE